MSYEDALERQVERQNARSQTRSAQGFRPIGTFNQDPQGRSTDYQHKFFTGTCKTHGNWQMMLFCGKASDGTWVPLGSTKPECPKCRAEQIEKEKAAEAEKMAERKIIEDKMNAQRLKDAREEAVSRSGIPSQYVASSFGNYRAKTPICADTKRQLMAYAENFDRIRKKGTGIFLYGPTGTGKTHLACALIHALMNKDVQCVFARTWEVLQDATEAGFEKAKVLDPLIKAEVLVLDEVGLQSGTKSEERNLYAVIDSRINARRPTIFTTNVQPDTAKKDADLLTVRRLVGDRVYDRMQWKSVMLKLDGESHRKRYASVDDILNDLETQK